MKQDSDEETDKELLTKLRQGDAAAFERVYQRYSGPIFINLLRMLRNEAQAEDFLQDIFVLVWQHRNEIDPEKSFRAYLYRIARNKVLNYFRRTSLETQVAAYMAASNSELYRHIEESIDEKERSELFYSAVEKLPPKRKQVYTLCKIEGRSYQEVAALLGCSVSAVNAHIVKATKTIEKELSLSGTILLGAIVDAFFRW